MLFARLIVASSLLAPIGSSAGDLLGTPAFPRHRPGLASTGPRGLPSATPPDARWEEPASQSAAKYPVEPASFQSNADVKPLVGRHALWPDDPSVESTGSAPRRTPALLRSTAPLPADGGSSGSTFVFRGDLGGGLDRSSELNNATTSISPAPALPAVVAATSVADAPPPALATPVAAVDRTKPTASEAPALFAAVPSPKRASASGADSRSLALPPGETTGGASKAFRPDNPLKALLAWRPSTGSLTTAGSALALVLGLLCLSAWVVKRSMPRSARVLPKDVAEVLGRVPLAGRQVGQLVRVGRKLLLVATTPNGIETLTEITDEEDVQNLLRICDESHGRGAQAAFDDIFRQMTREPAPRGFLGGEALDYDPRQLAAAYARTPGGRASA
jgi:flagellar biogenesis protein FliO